MAADKKFELDKVLMVTGNKGKYQKIQSFFLLIIVLSISYPILSIVFIGYVPEHRCAQLPNVTDFKEYDVIKEDIVDIRYHQCSIDIISNKSGVTSKTNIQCINGYEYDADPKKSIVSEWDLVCGRAGLAELSQTMLMLGQGIGAVVFTSLSDKYGRRPVHLISHAGLLASSVALIFINNIGGFIALRLIIGAMQQSVGLTGYAIFVELFTTDLRPYAGCFGGLSWTLSVMTLAPIGYLLQNYSWRYFQITCVVAMSSYVIFLILFLDESLRWLIANDKIEKAENIIKRICKTNKTDFAKSRLALYEQLQEIKAPKSQKENITRVKLDAVNELKELKQEPEVENNECKDDAPEKQPLMNGDSTETTQHKLEISSTREKALGLAHNLDDKAGRNEPDKYTVIDIFKNLDLLKLTIILCYIWAVNSLTYYGLFLTSSSLSGNRFLNFFLNAVVELPAMIVVFFALKRLGRRSVCGMFMAMSGISLIISVVLLSTVGETTIGSTSSLGFSLFGKFAITASFNCLFIYTPEIFPTNMRNAGLGVASSVARVGGMLAPYSSLLSDIVLWGPGVVFGCCCMIAAGLIMLMPETRNRPLPTTIEEMRAWKSVKSSTLELEIK